MTSIDWCWGNNGLPTNLPASPTDKDGIPSLRRLVMCSERDRLGTAKLPVAHWLYRPSILEAGKRFQDLVGGNRVVIVDYDMSHGIILITFGLLMREQFCVTAIRLAQRILELLGVADPDLRAIAQFTIEQTTYALSGAQWKPYESCLRHQLGLPDRQ